MSLTNETALEKMLGMFETGDVSNIEDVIAPGYVDHQRQGDAAADGWLSFTDVVQNLRLLYPDVQIAIQDLVAEADQVAVTLLWRATGLNGERFEAKSIDIVRFEEGRAVEHWGVSSGWP